LLQVCLNGGRSRAAHRAVPLFPEEIARDAARVVAAGAGALHVHLRAADGSETLDPPICDAVVLAIRDACPNIPVGLTTAIWIDRRSDQTEAARVGPPETNRLASCHPATTPSA
jgi:uncharacterized protein (DUF849 family)